MIDGLKAYPNYKDSGVPWLGKVPEHWEVRRLKSAVANVNEQTGQKHPDDLYIALENVESSTGHLRIPQNEVEFDSQVKRFEADDVLFGKLRPYLAKVVRPSCGGVCVGEFLVLRAKTTSVSPPYLELTLRSRPVIDAVDSSTFGAKMPRADWGFVGSMPLLLPPLPEQAAIARFLDWVNRRIRRVIRARQKRIKLLEEYKQALIHRAVTGQIDVRTGQPYPAYKPSGIEWLGQVPDHWNVARVRNVIQGVTSGSRGWSQYMADEGPLFVRITNLTRGSIDLDLSKIVRLNLLDRREAGRARIRPGDILISITAYIGSVAVAPADVGEAYVSQHVALCRPRGGNCPRWIAYVLLSPLGKAHGTISLYGGTKDGLSLDDVKNYPVLLPPLHEQFEIVGLIDRQSEEVVKGVRIAQREIDFLKEFRTRLIADVVTGKVDVREVAARLPDERETGEPEPLDAEATVEAAEAARDEDLGAATEEAGAQ